jgi:hypothetical protein
MLRVLTCAAQVTAIIPTYALSIGMLKFFLTVCTISIFEV